MILSPPLPPKNNKISSAFSYNFISALTEQKGYYYTLTDLLKQELPANESRQHTETVSVAS